MKTGEKETRILIDYSDFNSKNNGGIIHKEKKSLDTKKCPFRAFFYFFSWQVSFCISPFSLKSTSVSFPWASVKVTL